MSDYYFGADHATRRLMRRKCGAPRLTETGGLLWWRVDKPTWKAYRAGDIVALGDWPYVPPSRRPERER